MSDSTLMRLMDDNVKPADFKVDPRDRLANQPVQGYTLPSIIEYADGILYLRSDTKLEPQ